MAKIESNKLITNFPVPLSEEENQNLSLTLSGVVTRNGLWRPTVTAGGEISWEYDDTNSRVPPDTQNIMGPEGKAPPLSARPSDSHLLWQDTFKVWHDTNQTTSGAVGPAGKDGVDGQNGTDGKDGVTPTISVKPIAHLDTDPPDTNGGNRIVFEYGPGDRRNIAYSAFNGAPGQGGSGGGSYLAGPGIQIVTGQEHDTIQAKLGGPDIGFDTAGNICFNTDGTDGGGFFNMIEGHETWASGGSNHVEGMWTWAKGVGNHAQNVGCSAVGYGVNAQGLWTCFISDSGDGGDRWWNHGAGASVEGICNRTRETPYSAEGRPLHEGILKVIGNGHRLHPDVKYDASYVLSDAFIFYRDGTMWAAGDLEVLGKIHGYADSAEYAEKYYDPEDDKEYQIYESFRKLSGNLDLLGDALGYFEQVWDDYSGTFVNKPSGSGVENKYFLYNTYGGSYPWTDANGWLSNVFIGENGVYVAPYGPQGKIRVGVSGDYLPKSGGTVSGELVLSAATGNFDNEYLKFINNAQDGYYARFGLGSYGGAVIKAGGGSGNNPVQLTVKPSNNNSEIFTVTNNNSEVGHLIPAVIHQGSYTPSSDDGILHIVVEN